MGRGAGWTEAEDECLAKAWLWATDDAIDGTCQDAQSFLLKVSQDFCSRVGTNASERTGPSTKNRWNQTLRREFYKFIAIRDEIEALNPIGTTNEDRIAMAISRYSGIDIHEKSKSGQLQFMGAYIALKGCPKVTSTFSFSAKPSSNSDSNTPSLGVDACSNLETDGRRRIMDPQWSSLQCVDSADEGTEEAVSSLTRPNGKKAGKAEKRETQLQRLTRGGEAHVRSLERIARGMEDTSKRKRSDQLLSLYRIVKIAIPT
jgi:hypothetical protein